MRIDTGADTSIVPRTWMNRFRIGLRPAEKKLVATSYLGDTLPILGHIECPARVDGMDTTLVALVVDSDTTQPLLGMNMLTMLEYPLSDDHSRTQTNS